jgi:prophage DNA circulation protein
MDDLLATQFEECSWRGISFPIELVSEKGAQRLAIHNRMDRDGAQVESTGRAAYQFSVRAFFIEGLTQGTNESWADLFPQTWLTVKKYLEQKDTGTFVHPFYGKINCKPHMWSGAFTADTRAGIIVDIEFIETFDDKDGLISLEPSVISSATSSAADLDSHIADNKVPVNLIPKPLGKSNFFSAINTIINADILAIPRMINNVCNTIFNFIDNLIALGNEFASLFDAAYKLIDSLNTLLLTYKLQQKETSIYKVGFNTTLAAIAGFVGNTVENIIKLNPNLVGSIIINRGTSVIYYTL